MLEYLKTAREIGMMFVRTMTPGVIEDLRVFADGSFAPTGPI